MEADHCNMGDSNYIFLFGNFKERKTWPANEWAITVRGDYSRAHSSSSRTLENIDVLMDKDVAKQAGLTRPEVIAVVLYSGPMVSRRSCYRRDYDVTYLSAV